MIPSIQSFLFMKNLEDAYAPMLQELALCKSKITEQFDRNYDTLTVDMKMQYRADSLTMVDVLSFSHF